MSGAGDGWARWFDRAVGLYPSAFRERWGREMRALFRAEVRRARAAGGRPGAAMYAAKGIAAAVAGAGREWARVAAGRGRTGRRGEGMMLDEIRQDVTVLGRSLRRKPGFAVVVITTLAMGIGVTTGVFSVVRGVLLRPLPYDEPHELVYFGGGGASSLPNVADLGAAVETVAPVTGFFVPGPETLTGVGDPVELSRSFVGGDFFPMLGLPPEAGRLLGPEDDGTSRVVLAHALWTSRFGSDPGVVGRTLTLSEEPVEVVGVAPPELAEPFDADLYMPYPWAEGEGPRGNRGWRAVEVYGRLAPGRTLDEARTEVAGEWERLQAEHPAFNERWRVTLVELRSHVTEDEGPALAILFWASLLFLLIACANVAALFLGRLEARTREFAVRSALGAGRGRLIRQAWVEALAVGIAGGVVGVAAAALLLDRSLAAFGTSLSRVQEVALDGPVLLFSVGATLVTALAMGLVAVAAWRTGSPAAGLRSGGSRGGGGRTGWLRKSLVVGEVAMALVVVTALALLTRSFLEVQSVDVGLRTEGVVALDLGMLPQSRYPDGESWLGFVRELRERAAAVPGVQAAALAWQIPLAGCCNNRMWQRVDDPTREHRFVEARVVTPGYFDLLGIPLRAGRVLDPGDREGRPPVVVVNETLARALWDGGSPVGEAIRPGGTEATLEVVGVVGDVREYSPEREAPPIVYLPVGQNVTTMSSLLVRSDLPAARVGAELRAVVGELDPLLPVESVRSLDDHLAGMVAERRATTALMSFMGVLAFVLGGIGVYGVVSHSVTTRIREIGVRMALGAPRRNVLGRVVGRALLLVLPGVALGAAGAVAAHGLIESLLFGVTPFDPWVWVTVLAVFLAVAVVAASGPARRAASVDVVEILKETG